MKTKLSLIGRALFACLSGSVLAQAETSPWLPWGSQPVGNTSAFYAMTCDSGAFPGTEKTSDALLVKPSSGGSNIKVTVSTNAAPSTWQEVGQSFGAQAVSEPSIVVTADSIYVSNCEGPTDGNLNGKPGVYAYKKSDHLTGTWQSITGSLTGPATDTRLAYGNGSLYLVTMANIAPYSSGTTNKRIRVYKYDGTDWTELAADGLTKGNVQNAGLQIAPDGTPYLDYRLERYYIRVQKYADGKWQTLTPAPGLEGFTESIGRNLMSIDTSGTVSVVCTNSKGLGQVKSYTQGKDGSYSWTDLGSSYATNPDRPQIVNVGTFGPWVFYQTSERSDQVAVKELSDDKTAWVDVGTDIASGHNPPISLVLAGSTGGMLSFLTYNSGSLEGYHIHLLTAP